MFDLFRRRDKAIRYLLTVLLGLVALSMVITLIPGYGTPQAADDNVIAEVAGEPISTMEVQQLLQGALRNRQIPREMLQMYLPQFIDQMVRERAVAYEAKRLGFEVSDAELATAIRSILANYMPVNNFNREAYQRFLADQNLTIEQFEANVRKNLLLLRLQNMALEGIIVPPQEINDEFHRRNDKVKIEYVAFSSQTAVAGVTVTREEALGYYNKNRSVFNTPERRTFDLLIADEQKMATAVTPPEAQIRQAYQTNIDRYRTPERVRARHILIKTTDKPSGEVPKLEAKANDLLKQLRAGADFAELAKKNSDDTGSAVKGGDLDWVTRGQTVKAFEDTAFSLPPNQISNVVKTEYGFHVIQVLEKQPAQVKPFEEARAELEKEVKRSAVFNQMQDAIDQARAELVKNPRQAEAIAKKYGLTFVHAGALAAGQSVPEIGTSAELQASITEAKPGEVTPIIQLGPDKLGVAVLIGVEPPKPAEFAQVEPQIMGQLKGGKEALMARQKAEEATEKVRAAKGDLKSLAQAFGTEIKSSEFVGMEGNIEGLGPVASLPDVFNKPEGSTLGPISIGDKVIAARIVAKQRADETQLAAGRDKLMDELKRRKAQERKELFEEGVVSRLTKEGKIKKYPDAIRRLETTYRS